jgi:hypothetical protein
MYAQRRENEKESDVKEQARLKVAVAALLLGTAAITGCHQAKTPVASAEDVANAQQAAQKEVQDARLEAKKDLRNAVKQAGSDSQNAVVARATGDFDIAMANADGDHKVALERCLTLPPASQQSCKDQADAQYQAAASTAKAARVAKLSKG